MAAALAHAGASLSTESFRPAGGAAPADIDGASHGYTSPTKVESPFSPDEKAALSRKIPCPALAGMFNAGMLKVEKDGTVKIPDLERGSTAVKRSALVMSGSRVHDHFEAVAARLSGRLNRLGASRAQSTFDLFQRGPDPHSSRFILTFCCPERGW